MTSNKHLKIWSGVISSLALLHTEAAANIQSFNTDTKNDGTHITVQKDSKPDLFLQQAISDYSDIMQFAGHRSHYSHRSHRSHYSHRSHSSHYSSSTYTSPAPPTTSPPATTPPPPPPPATSTPQGSSQYKSYKATGNTPTKSPNATTPVVARKVDTTSIKIVQVALNLLGYNAGKVDGKIGQQTRQAIKKFQTNKKIAITGQINGQTCLYLARTVKDELPNNPNAKKIHDNLISTYIRISTK